MSALFSHLQTWTKIPASQIPSHPVSREGHSAVSLHDPDSNPANPALLVMWGADDGCEILRDSWIFHLNQRQWRKVFGNIRCRQLGLLFNVYTFVVM